jgi:biopolymer transport protein ExbD
MILGGGSGLRGFGGGGAGGGEIPSVSLNLTALMDILSNLLFFLLAAYTAQSLEVKQKADLQLPVSSSQLSVKPSLTLFVGQNDIQLGGETVVGLRGTEILGPVEDEDRIVPLFDKLRGIKDARAAAGRADAPEADVVLLLADKATDSSVIMKVLKTAGLAGFVNVRFGVLSP